MITPGIATEVLRRIAMIYAVEDVAPDGELLRDHFGVGARLARD